MEKKISLENRQKRVSLSPRRITDRIKKILRHEGVLRYDLSIAFVTDAQIRRLNKTYLGRDHTTDVLAFDLSSSKARRGKALNGEIIISTAAACRHAKIYKTTAEQEVLLYIIHGILHLCGYDDHNAKDTERMRRKEHALLKLITTQKHARQK